MDGLIEKIERYIKESDVNRPKKVLSGWRYLKYDMVDSISKILDLPDAFSDKLYNTIPKNELKKSYYGMITVSIWKDFKQTNDDLSEILLRTIHEYEIQNDQDVDIDINWFKIAFYAGLWESIQKYHHPYMREYPLTELTKITPYDLIKSGYNIMHKKYAVNRKKGKYTREGKFKIPGSQYFRIDDTGKYRILTDDLFYTIRTLSNIEKPADYNYSKLEELINRIKNSRNIYRISEILYGNKIKEIQDFVELMKKKSTYQQLKLF